MRRRLRHLHHNARIVRNIRRRAMPRAREASIILLAALAALIRHRDRDPFPLLPPVLSSRSPLAVVPLKRRTWCSCIVHCGASPQSLGRKSTERIRVRARGLCAKIDEINSGARLLETRTVAISGPSRCHAYEFCILSRRHFAGNCV